MKPTHLAYLTLLWMLPAFGIGQNLTFSPEKPTTESVVSFTYDASQTDLAGKEISAVAYFLDSEGMPEAVDVDLTSKGDMHKGEVKLGEKAKAVFVSFMDEKGETTENNDGKGYGKMIYQAGGASPVDGAYAAYANAIAGGPARFMQLESNPEKGLKLMAKEFEANPSKKNDYLMAYASMARQAKDQDILNMVKEEVKAINQKKKASEDEMMMAYNISSMLKDGETKDALETKIKKKFKKGELVQMDAYRAFYAEKDAAKKTEIFEQFVKKYGEMESAKNLMGYMARMQASAAGNAGDWAAFDKYLGMMDDPSSKASMLNGMAWDMAGGGLKGEAKNAEKAMALSKQSIDIMQKLMEDPGDNKPSFYSPKQFKKNLKRGYGQYADTYALTLYKAGKKDEALAYQEKACKINKFEDAEMNERYCVYYEGKHSKADCEKLIEGFIRKGTASANMKTRHKALFMENHNMESAYGKYLGSLEADALAAMRKKIEKKLIDMEAPAFTLKNLDGETVSLADLKGKVVVVDFWATWCGPCKASFPGMQRAQDQLADRDDVAFLFIDTWENVKNKEENAAKFIEKNEYTFNVLMDNDSKVVSEFKVEGIPTKFIIGKDNRIKFKSVGYSGNDEELVNEIKMMIEIAGADGASMASGAP